MFINTGSREIKKLMSVTFEYDPKDTYYSRKNIEKTLRVMRNLTPVSYPYPIKKDLLTIPDRILSFLPKEKLKYLINLEKGYNGSIFFSYDNPNKKKKTHNVNFYVIPNEAYGYTRTANNSKSPYSNEKIFLKSKVRLPDTLVSGNPYMEKIEKKRLKFVRDGYNGKKVPFKNIFNFIDRDMRFTFDKEVYELEQGLYPASINDMNSFVYIETDFFGTPNNPAILLIEAGFFKEKDLLRLKEKGIYKEI